MYDFCNMPMLQPHLNTLFCLADRKSTSGMRQSRPAIAFDAACYFKLATCQVQEVSGEFRPVTLYRHKQHAETVVLDFGDDEYEGLEGDYSLIDTNLSDSDGSPIAYKDLSMCSKSPRLAPPVSCQPPAAATGEDEFLAPPASAIDEDKRLVRHPHHTHEWCAPHVRLIYTPG